MNRMRNRLFFATSLAGLLAAVSAAAVPSATHQTHTNDIQTLVSGEVVDGFRECGAYCILGPGLAETWVPIGQCGILQSCCGWVSCLLPSNSKLVCCGLNQRCKPNASSGGDPECITAVE